MSTQTARVGVVGKSIFYSGSDLGNDNAMFHSIPRGAYLGTSVTSDQWAEIGSGKFRNLYVGDYWLINDFHFRIGDPNYWLNYGDTACTKNHLLIVPDESLTSAKLNNTNITTGAIVGSDWYTGNNSNTAKATVKSIIEAAFGAEHILTHREYLKNAVTNGYESGGSWYDSTFELMTEEMVYGTKEFKNGIAGTNIPANYTVDHSQISLFRYAHHLICNRGHWWLRDVASSAYFAVVANVGNCDFGNASGSFGIRPAFGICA